MLTDEGKKNLNELFEKRFGVSITDEWLAENESGLAESFYEPEEFYRECNENSVDDTAPREVVMNYVALKYAKMDWPLYMDIMERPEIQNEFLNELSLGIKADMKRGVLK